MRLTFFQIQSILVLVIAIGVLMILLSSFITNPRDNTDPPNGRSGMMLLTDHMTGCQYLYRHGAITPRMGKDGKQLCEVTL